MVYLVLWMSNRDISVKTQVEFVIPFNIPHDLQKGELSHLDCEIELIIQSKKKREPMYEVGID